MSFWAELLSVLALLTSVVVAWLTHRESGKAQVRTAEVTTRGAVEEAAFARAEAFYTKVIERQDKELEEQAAHIERLEQAIANVKERTEMCEVDCASLRAERGYWIRTAQVLARGVHQLRQHVDPDHTDHTLVELDETVLRVLNEDLKEKP